ncbi:MAG: hypothetical protein ACO3N3_13405 [bacterium]
MTTKAPKNTNWPKRSDGSYERYHCWGAADNWISTDKSNLLFVTIDESCDVPEGIFRGMISTQYEPSVNPDNCPVGTKVNLTLVEPTYTRFSDGIAHFDGFRDLEGASVALQAVLSNTLDAKALRLVPNAPKEKLVINDVNKATKFAFFGRCMALQVDKADAIAEAMDSWLKSH